jgi:phosphotriesterase-related protein
MRTIQTVTGAIDAEALGTTLMHEHLAIGWPGWEAEAPADRAARREHAKRCVASMEELKGHGLGTLVDPCPIDLGRDVELMAEVAQATGVRIVARPRQGRTRRARVLSSARTGATRSAG